MQMFVKLPNVVKKFGQIKFEAFAERYRAQQINKQIECFFGFQTIWLELLKTDFSLHS